MGKCKHVFVLKKLNKCGCGHGGLTVEQLGLGMWDQMDSAAAIVLPFICDKNEVAGDNGCINRLV